MSISLHPELCRRIERESARILGLVEDLTALFRQRPTSSMHPDTHIQANVTSEDIIGEVVVSFSDVTGTRIVHFYPDGDKTLGLAEDNLQQAREIAKRIWCRREVRDHLSAETVEELLLEWVGAAARGHPTEPLAQRINQV